MAQDKAQDKAGSLIPLVRPSRLPHPERGRITHPDLLQAMYIDISERLVKLICDGPYPGESLRSETQQLRILVEHAVQTMQLNKHLCKDEEHTHRLELVCASLLYSMSLIENVEGKLHRSVYTNGGASWEAANESAEILRVKRISQRLCRLRRHWLRSRATMRKDES